MDTGHIGHEEYMRRMAAGPQPDMVNSPPHYNQGAVECIDAIESALGPDGFRAYCRGSAMKYLWRCELKHKDNRDDWLKARWYLNRLIDDGDPDAAPR